MSTNFQTMDNACPVAYVAINKQRVKQYNNNVVYLKNNNEFQLELFNPTAGRVLAKIELNGTSIGSGIILRPAERVFLERYIDVPKKFLFETYEVNGENEQTMKAIEKNGLVSVKFYKEVSNYFNWSNFPTIQADRKIWGGPDYPHITWMNGSHSSGGNHLFGQPFTTSSCYCSTNIDSNTINGNYHSSSDITLDGITSVTSTNTVNLSNKSRSKSIETGRVEKGSNSDQNFETVDAKFEFFSTWSSEWKLLPESRKLVVAEDLVTYCSSCGRKKKSNERFCPSCGNKF